MRHHLFKMLGKKPLPRTTLTADAGWKNEIYNIQMGPLFRRTQEAEIERHAAKEVKIKDSVMISYYAATASPVCSFVI